MAIHWATRRLDRGPTLWIGLGFAVGSTCFLVGPFPGFVELVGAKADAIVFFAGSVFFTAAALQQALQSMGSDRLPSLIQFAGTIFFNVSTFRAMRSAFSDPQIDRLIWAPEAVGSACFLFSGVIAYRSVRAADHRRAAARSGGSQRSTSPAASSSQYRAAPLMWSRRPGTRSTSPPQTGRPVSGRSAF